MAIVIAAPNEVYSVENSNNIKLYLAGGITNCWNWQSELIKQILTRHSFPDLTVYNPRRENFPINDPKAAEEQVTWEFNHLRDADIVSFWFSEGSLNPIVLYELGMWCNSRTKPCVIGIDPNYERKQDVEIQTALARPQCKIVYSLKDVVDWILMYMLGVLK